MKKIAVALCMLSLIVSSTMFAPSYTYAQQSVPIGTLFNWHNIQQQLKDFVLKGLAWNIAKMALQQLTTSVVNWINTGFEGSPAFITDPEGYFIDLADQATGQMISNSGALKGLCSPWNIDVRLSLALGQTRSASDGYLCTLGAIIGNAKNASVNGYSIEGFTSGDFSQGGWPAFIAMTSEPQNNPYGSYLKAKSDLEAQIMGKQNKVNNDLNRGQGFLSRSQCSNITEDDIKYDYGANASELKKLGLEGDQSISSKNTANYGDSITKTTDSKTGKTVYQKCSVQTPGSVINSGLNKVLGSGVDQLNLADDINEITSALFAQLMSQVLTKGLGGTTQRSSGSTQSYIDQLYSQSSGAGAYANSNSNIQASYAPYITDARNIKETYGKAVAAFQAVHTDFSSAQGCFQDITVAATDAGDRSAAQSALNAIQTILINQVVPAETVYTTKYGQASSIVDTIGNEVSKAGAVTDPESAQIAANNLQSFLSTQVSILEQGRINSAADLTAAEAQAAPFDVTAKQYITQCQSLKSNPGSGSASKSGKFR